MPMPHTQPTPTEVLQAENQALAISGFPEVSGRQPKLRNAIVN